MKKKLRIVAYFRVSGKKQGQSGLGLEAQKATVAAYAAQHGGEIIAEYIEVETGTGKRDRPKMTEAIAHARLANATLVIAKIDRLARNLHFITGLMKCGVDFVSCDNPHASPLYIHILAAVAEDEARQISQRTVSALHAAKARGVKLGSARPGHWDGREHLRGWAKATKAAAEQRSKRAQSAYAFLVPRMQQMYADGKTHEQIAEWLNEQGHTTTADKPFTKTAVWRILKREGTEKVAA
ncbi:MAG: resolvase [Planctomycetota bacterium]|nr:MAG: resolvase [Planctomycetota bacterium]REK23298.1 MAG: resolvase [Planctomycetota bacterium]REK39218.1 MAG: resolvase [Planctomycetota bacterium]